MKKIAILTSGRLPVPATKGGAVETKLDYILDYNAVHQLFDITIYSIAPDKNIDKSTECNHYVHYSFTSFWTKLRKAIYKKIFPNIYYDGNIEFFLQKCIKDIKRHSFDAIVLANRPGYAIAIPPQSNTKIILQINNDYLNNEKWRAKEIKQRCDLIITCSDYINSIAGGVPCSKNVPVVTVHNGIDIRRFVEAEAIQRASLGISEKDYVVFFSGRLTKEKGILELIQAVKMIKTIPNLKLIIAGASFYGADKTTSPYLHELQEASKDIKEKVLFTGFIKYKMMPSYLKIANIIVVPSLWEEPFGLTVLEAMAAGVPLIATRCGGIPEICEGVATLIDRDNVCENIANAIKYLYNNPELAKELAQAAVARSWTFDKDIFAKKYLETIKENL